VACVLSNVYRPSEGFSQPPNFHESGGAKTVTERLPGIVESLFGSGYAELGSGCAKTYDAVFSDYGKPRFQALQ
jgi:hypothetical protein